MISLSDSEIDKVYDYLIDHGLTYEVLRNELLDHICCLIEEHMQHGAQFEWALQQAQKQFGPLGIERTQEATIYLITIKLRKMKKAASILGIIGGIATICGTLFKVMHWPGAGILLLSGLVVTALFFMPAALFVNYQSKDGIKDRATVVAGFAGGIILTLFALFKVMHWPGASMLMILALAEIILVFIPLYYIKSYRNPENKWFDIGSLTVIVASIIMVLVLYSASGPSTAYLNGIRNLEEETIKSYEHLNFLIDKRTKSLSGTEKEAAAQQLQWASQLVVDAFYQYRNTLLNKDYKPDFSQYNQHLQQINNSELAENRAWQKLKTSTEELNKAQADEKPKLIGQVLLSYQNLAANIIDAKKAKTDLKSIARSIENLPITHVNGYESNLLYNSFLNMAEFQLKQYQLQLLD